MSEPNQEAPSRFSLRRALQLTGRIFSLIRSFVLNLLTLLILIAVLVFVFSSDDKVAVPDNAVLVLNPTGSIVESRIEASALTDFWLFGSPSVQTSIHDILNTIEFAAEDDRVKLLLLDFSRVLAADFSQIERIQAAIESFKLTNKPVWAHASSYSQAQYAMSLGADKISMDPLGSLILSGVSITSQYYKGLLDKLNIDINVFAQGDFKSAIEPYTRNSKSEHVLVAQQAQVRKLWNRMVLRISSERGLDVKDVLTYAAQLHQLGEPEAVSLASIPVQAGLIDELLETERLSASVDEYLDLKSKQIGFSSYLPHVPESTASFGEPRIAVVVVEGEILGLNTLVSGKPSGWINQITRVTEDDDFDALVVRVNSPGGSVIESEALRRSLRKYTETDRPLVVSMGGVAASGGYWIATPADHIMATPVTITGSIGVFGLHPNVERALESVGINTEVVSTTPFTSAQSFTKSPSPALLELRQRQVADIYERFVGLVMASRDKSFEEMHEIAQGRVWLGSEALNHGLVDSIGDFDESIAKAAELADVSQFHVEFVRGPSSPFDPVQNLIQDARSAIAELVFPASQLTHAVSERLRYVQDPSSIYAQCLECFVDLN